MISKFVLILVFLPVAALALTAEDHIDQNYNKLVDQVYSFGFPEKMAQEISQVALIRQLHEDGPGKKCDYSAVGMYPGPPNSFTLDFVLTGFLNLRKSVIPTPEGTSCYALKGENACIASALCIAFLYEDYVFRFNSFKQEERTIWEKSKAGCPEHIWKAKERLGILKKADRTYGPNSEGVLQLVLKHKALFDQKRSEVKAEF